MNEFIRNSVAFWGRFVPLTILRSGEKPAFLPFYHAVEEQQPDYIKGYVVRNQKQFERELDFFLEYYQPVGLNDIMNKPDKRKMHLTFDDGLKSCVTTIAPILKRKGIPATFFVNPGCVDNKYWFHGFKRAILQHHGVLSMNAKYSYNEREKLDELIEHRQIVLQAYNPYMNFDEIGRLKEEGFNIGAHSIDHPEMWLLSEEEQKKQVVDSMNWVLDHFSPEIKAFSFPYTDNGLTKNYLLSLRKENILDVSFGTAGLKKDEVPGHFQRVPMEHRPDWSVRKVLHYEYFYYFVRSIVGKNTVTH